jgi:hypothetical protein
VIPCVLRQTYRMKNLTTHFLGKKDARTIGWE